jgi:AraC family transcriptional regulator, regulatory protein of adaptative response / DNA-3-methyladenine glycosylase II
MTVTGIDPRALYEAILTRDRRFDGRVYVGVRTTRIYCRPVCTVRPPRFENCTFYSSAAAAESAGFRPCLRCRPELAPGSSAPVDAVSRLASLAVRRIEDGALSGLSVEELASEFGVTGRHLRRCVHKEVGLTPVALAQTQRLLLAKQLLTDTRMTVTEAAFAAGFESLRRFNATFKDRYRMTPTDLRRMPRRLAVETDDIYSFDLAVRPPFDLASMLVFWDARSTAGVEQVVEGWYRRTVCLGGHVGWVGIGPPRKPHSVRVVVSRSLGPALTSILSRLKAMLDVRAEPVEVGSRLSADSQLAPLVTRWPGVRVPGSFDGFECGIRSVLGQQVSVRAATTIAGRLAAKFGQPISTPHDGLTTAFPSPQVLATTSLADLRSLGLTARRAETIQRLSSAVADGKIHLQTGADPDRVREALLAVPGIGDWTAEYLLLRAVGWPDAFPSGDLALVKAAGFSAKELRDRSEQWRPWRGYAAILLWRSLGLKNTSVTEAGAARFDGDAR